MDDFLIMVSQKVYVFIRLQHRNETVYRIVEADYVYRSVSPSHC